jgi:hypothetical protein
MSRIADLVAYDPEGRIVLVAEVKSRTNTSRDWATRMRRNVLAHGLVPSSRFFLLALPDKLYLWKDVGTAPEMVEPTYEIDATPFFRPYYEKAKIAPDELSGQSFELIVISWLNVLIWSGVSEDVPEAQRRSIEDSGLLDALKGGSIAVPVAA